MTMRISFPPNMTVGREFHAERDRDKSVVHGVCRCTYSHRGKSKVTAVPWPSSLRIAADPLD